jgi:adhesin transport system outer membrane protein
LIGIDRRLGELGLLLTAFLALHPATDCLAAGLVSEVHLLSVLSEAKLPIDQHAAASADGKSVEDAQAAPVPSEVLVPKASSDEPPKERAPVISEVGRELIALLEELAAGELDPARRLPLSPVLTRALKTVETIPQLKIASEAKLVAEAQRREALAGYFPQVNVSASSGQRDFSQFGTQGSGIGQQTTITGKQLIYDFGATPGAVRAADRRIEASEQRIAAQKSEILLRAIEVFYETQRALMLVRLSRENLQARRSFVSYIRDRAELGASSRADVVRAEARVAESLEQLSSAMQKLSVAQAAYRQFYGQEAEPYVLPLDPYIEELSATAYTELLLRHPQLIESELGMEAASEELSVNKARLWGGVFFELNRSNFADPGRPPGYNNSAMVVLRSDVYTGGQQQARIAQADARLAQARAERERTRLELEKALREAVAEHAGQVAAVSARLLLFRASTDTYQISKDLYAFSRSSLFEVFKAQEELYGVGQRLIDSLIDRAKSKFKLLHASQRFNNLLMNPECATREDPIQCVINSR